MTERLTDKQRAFLIRANEPTGAFAVRFEGPVASSLVSRGLLNPRNLMGGKYRITEAGRAALPAGAKQPPT